MEIVGWVVNTTVLLFVVGLVVAYGKWLGSEIMSINQKIARWEEPIAAVNDCKRKINSLERDLAVHCAAPHCGEAEKNK